jgi:hypothetical protein
MNYKKKDETHTLLCKTNAIGKDLIKNKVLSLAKKN